MLLQGAMTWIYASITTFNIFHLRHYCKRLCAKVKYAWKRSKAGGDVQLFNLDATNSDGPSNAADTHTGGPRA
jgi:hypothetical protein